MAVYKIYNLFYNKKDKYLSVLVCKIQFVLGGATLYIILLILLLGKSSNIQIRFLIMNYCLLWNLDDRLMHPGVNLIKSVHNTFGPIR